MRIEIKELELRKNPPLNGGQFYKITGRKDGIKDTYGTRVVFVPYGYNDIKVQYFNENGITHSDKAYCDATYWYEPFVGTVTIEVP